MHRAAVRGGGGELDATRAGSTLLPRDRLHSAAVRSPAARPAVQQRDATACPHGRHDRRRRGNGCAGCPGRVRGATFRLASPRRVRRRRRSLQIRRIRSWRTGSWRRLSSRVRDRAERRCRRHRFRRVWRGKRPWRLCADRSGHARSFGARNGWHNGQYCRRRSAGGAALGGHRRRPPDRRVGAAAVVRSSWRRGEGDGCSR